MIPGVITIPLIITSLAVGTAIILSKHADLPIYKKTFFMMALVVSLFGHSRGSNLHLALSFLLVSPKELRSMFTSMVFLIFFETDDDSDKYSVLILAFMIAYSVLTNSFIEHSWKFFDSRYRTLNSIDDKPVPY